MRGVLMAAAALAGCSSPPPAARKESSAPVPPVKITQFYATPSRIPRGGSSQLCYGVEGATRVTLSPRVDEVWPSMSRCVEAKPGATTTYTLTATDAAGKTASRTAVIEVGAPAARAVRLIQEVTVNKLDVTPGEKVVICYVASNASTVKVTPGEEGVQRSPSKGCVTDQPVRTTTYVVTATGEGGVTDSERVTVTVR